MAAHYPIRVVARMTGLSVDTLRAWERRYQAVVPIRNDRGRMYSDRHVDRLKQLGALVAGGHAIGSIAGLPDAGLKRLLAGTSDVPDGAAEPAHGLDSLLNAIAHYDLPTAESILNRYAFLLPPADLIFNVMLPLLRALGSRWEAGVICPAQEHFASGIIRGVLGGLLRSMPPPASGTRLVFAATSGERHELGLLCGAVLAGAAGHGVVFLGSDLPATDITHAVRHTKATTLVLAATAEGAADADDMRKLKRLPDAVSIWIGGAQSASWKAAIGPRARQLTGLDELRGLLDRHAV